MNISSRNFFALIFCCFVAIILLPFVSFAKNTTALELSNNCKEIEKGSVGGAFDKELASMCSGYMEGFNDSMIIVNEFAKKRQFCLPKSIASSINIRLLDEWVKQNEKLAPKTTAAVALFAAMKKAFPCNK